MSNIFESKLNQLSSVSSHFVCHSMMKTMIHHSCLECPLPVKSQPLRQFLSRSRLYLEINPKGVTSSPIGLYQLREKNKYGFSSSNWSVYSRVIHTIVADTLQNTHSNTQTKRLTKWERKKELLINNMKCHLFT